MIGDTTEITALLGLFSMLILVLKSHQLIFFNRSGADRKKRSPASTQIQKSQPWPDFCCLRRFMLFHLALFGISGRGANPVDQVGLWAQAQRLGLLLRLRPRGGDCSVAAAATALSLAVAYWGELELLEDGTGEAAKG